MNNEKFRQQHYIYTVYTPSHRIARIDFFFQALSFPSSSSWHVDQNWNATAAVDNLDGYMWLSPPLLFLLIYGLHQFSVCLFLISINYLKKTKMMRSKKLKSEFIEMLALEMCSSGAQQEPLENCREQKTQTNR